MDFTEVFAPTAQQASLRVLLAHAAEHDLPLSMMWQQLS